MIAVPKNKFEILKHGEFYVEPEEVIVCSECKSADIDKNFQEYVYAGESLFFEKRQDYYLYKCNLCGCEFKRVVKTKNLCKIPRKKLIFGSMIAISVAELIAAFFTLEFSSLYESALACCLIILFSVISVVVLLFGIIGMCGALD